MCMIMLISHKLTKKGQTASCASLLYAVNAQYIGRALAIFIMETGATPVKGESGHVENRV